MTSLRSRLMRKMKGTMMKWVPGMLNCMEFETFLIEYMEGDLPAGQRRVFEFHMVVCRECRDYLAAYRRTIEIAGRAYDDETAPVPSDVPEDLVRAILAARNC
jgi:anti-sigma factor RsiW